MDWNYTLKFPININSEAFLFIGVLLYVCTPLFVNPVGAVGIYGEPSAGSSNWFSIPSFTSFSTLDFIISIFLLRAWWLHSWGAHTRTCMHRNTQRPPSFFSCTHTQSHMQKCDYSALSVLLLGAERHFLCISATEIDLQKALSVCPKGYSVIQYVLSQSPRLFCSLFLPPPSSFPPPSASATLQNGGSEWSDSRS